MEEDAFRRFRLQHGVYGIRGQEDIQMVRVKVPFGALSGVQLACLGDIAEHFARGVGHITTRQDLQLYWIPLNAVPQVLRRLAEVGLTTRESSGNIVRNVTACPLAGVCADEAFDVTPYAAAMSRYLMRNPVCQTLPRKFKIAFSGCGTDCAAAGIHDIGAVATLQDEGGVPRRGFRLFVGGGLGHSPRAAHLLEPFTPVEDLILTATAVIRVFDRLGNRQNRARARMKFLIEELGAEKFNQLVFAEREVLWAAWPGGLPPVPAAGEPSPPTDAGPPAVSEAPHPGFDSWRATNVVDQRQPGFCAAFVTVPGGDLSAGQFRALAALVRRSPGIEVRVTITQNLVLRWVHESGLPALHAELKKIGFGDPDAGLLADVVGCPGTDSCKMGITSSTGVSMAIREAALNDWGYRDDPLVQAINVKASGCPNGCSQHHLAAIGLQGSSFSANGATIPCFDIFLGGGSYIGGGKFGTRVARIPSKRTPQAVKKMIDHYVANRNEGEEFVAFIDRLGPKTFDPIFDEFKEVGLFHEEIDVYMDWGKEEPFEVIRGEGECSV